MNKAIDTKIVKEHVITDYFSVVLYDDGEVYARIGDKDIIQCRHAILSTSPYNDEILSVNQIIDASKDSFNMHDILYPKFDEMTEFVAHSSNLQAWYEHGFDPFLCDSRIAFPLLAEMRSIGIEYATVAYTRFFVERWVEGNEKTRIVLIEMFDDLLGNNLGDNEKKRINQFLKSVFNISKNVYDELVSGYFRHFSSRINDERDRYSDVSRRGMNGMKEVLCTEVARGRFSSNSIVDNVYLLRMIDRMKAKWCGLDDESLSVEIRNLAHELDYFCDVVSKLIFGNLNDITSCIRRRVSMDNDVFGDFFSSIEVSDPMDYPAYLFSRGFFHEFVPGTWDYETRPDGGMYYYIGEYARVISDDERREFVTRFPSLAGKHFYIENVIVRFDDGHYEKRRIVPEVDEK